MPALAHLLHHVQASQAVASTSSFLDLSLSASGAPSRAAMRQAVASAVSERSASTVMVGSEVSLEAAAYSMDSLRTVNAEISPVTSGSRELTDVTHAVIQREEQKNREQGRRRRDAQGFEAVATRHPQSIVPWATTVPEMKTTPSTSSPRQPLMRF